MPKSRCTLLSWIFFLLLLLSTATAAAQADIQFEDKLDNVAKLFANENYDEAIVALRELMQLVQDKASLHASRPVACESINTFGDYVPREDDVYAPGDTILLYTEIRNFTMPQTETGLYDLWVKEDIRLYGQNDFQIWGKEGFIDYHYSFRTRISDLFLQNRLSLPSGFPEGKFTVKMEIHDILGGKKTQAEYTFFVKKSEPEKKPDDQTQPGPDGPDQAPQQVPEELGGQGESDKEAVDSEAVE